MHIQEFKILLKLLGKIGYQGKIGDVKPNDKTKVTVVRNLCEQLFNRGYIEVEEKILKININASGKKNLKNKVLSDKLNNLELIILNSCNKKSIKSAEININSASKRDKLILDLLEKGLIDIAEKQIISITLTANGQFFLAQEFLLKGLGNITLSKTLLNNYLIFIREYYKPNIIKGKNKPSTEEVLETIIKLDKEFNTDNYLPIFYVRDQYQSILNRQELDDILYSLQKQNKLSMSRLVDGSQYNTKQYDAGIPQKIGGPIFYLIVK